MLTIDANYACAICFSRCQMKRVDDQIIDKNVAWYVFIISCMLVCPPLYFTSSFAQVHNKQEFTVSNAQIFLKSPLAAVELTETELNNGKSSRIFLNTQSLTWKCCNLMSDFLISVSKRYRKWTQNVNLSPNIKKEKNVRLLRFARKGESVRRYLHAMKGKNTRLYPNADRAKKAVRLSQNNGRDK